MGKVLRFPMNAPLNLPINIMRLALGRNGDDDKNTTPDDDHGDASLLAILSFVRDCLGDKEDRLDADTQRQCLQAVDGALNAAMSLERTVLHQTLHIEDMARIACTDQLTGAYNRRGFEQEFARVLAAATRYDETGVLVYVDLDGFKPINDTYGHAAGDLVLGEVTRVLQKHVRPQDLVARIGGDEFCVLLTRTDWKNGLERAEILKHLLNTTYVRWNDKNIAVRASFGFQRFGAHEDADALLSKADSAMYEAKRLRGGSHGADL